MNATFVRRMPPWRSLVWVGVIGSVLAWTWAWYVSRGPSVVLVFFALASVVLAVRGTQGMRWAIVGLMLTGFVMFLAGLYWLMMLVFMSVGQVPTQDWLSTSVVPMFAAVVLLMGAVAGFRHATSD